MQQFNIEFPTPDKFSSRKKELDDKLQSSSSQKKMNSLTNCKNDRIQFFKAYYDSRLIHFTDLIQKTCKQILKDELLLTMADDRTSQEFFNMRLREIIEDNLINEKEIKLEQITQQNEIIIKEHQQTKEQLHQIKLDLNQQIEIKEQQINELKSMVQLEQNQIKYLKQENQIQEDKLKQQQIQYENQFSLQFEQSKQQEELQRNCLQRKIQELQKEIDLNINNKEKFQQIYTNYENEINKYKQQNEDLLKQIDLLNTKIDDIQQKLEDTLSSQQKLLADNLLLNQQITQLDNLIIKGNQSKEQLEEEINQQQNKIRSLQSKIEKESQEFEKQIIAKIEQKKSKYKQQYFTLQKRYQEKKEAHAQIDQECGNLQAENRLLSERIHELVTQIQLEKEIQCKLESQNNEQSEEIKLQKLNYEQEILKLKNQFTQENEQLKEENNTNMYSLDINYRQMLENEKTVFQLQKELEFENLIQKHKDEILTQEKLFQQKLTDYVTKQEYEGQKKQNEYMQVEAAKIKQQLKALQNELCDNKILLEKNQSQIGLKEQIIQDLTNQIESEQQTIIQQKENITEMQNELQQKINEITQLNQMNDELNNEKDKLLQQIDILTKQQENLNLQLNDSQQLIQQLDLEVNKQKLEKQDSIKLIDTKLKSQVQQHVTLCEESKNIKQKLEDQYRFNQILQQQNTEIQIQLKQTERDYTQLKVNYDNFISQSNDTQQKLNIQIEQQAADNRTIINKLKQDYDILQKKFHQQSEINLQQNLINQQKDNKLIEHYQEEALSVKKALSIIEQEKYILQNQLQQIFQEKSQLHENLQKFQEIIEDQQKNQNQIELKNQQRENELVQQINKKQLEKEKQTDIIFKLNSTFKNVLQSIKLENESLKIFYIDELDKLFLNNKGSIQDISNQLIQIINKQRSYIQNLKQENQNQIEQNNIMNQLKQQETIDQINIANHKIQQDLIKEYECIIEKQQLNISSLCQETDDYRINIKNNEILINNMKEQLFYEQNEKSKLKEDYELQQSKHQSQIDNQKSQISIIEDQLQQLKNEKENSQEKIKNLSDSISKLEIENQIKQKENQALIQKLTLLQQDHNKIYTKIDDYNQQYKQNLKRSESSLNSYYSQQKIQHNNISGNKRRSLSNSKNYQQKDFNLQLNELDIQEANFKDQYYFNNYPKQPNSGQLNSKMNFSHQLLNSNHKMSQSDQFFKDHEFQQNNKINKILENQKIVEKDLEIQKQQNQKLKQEYQIVQAQLIKQNEILKKFNNENDFIIQLNEKKKQEFQKKISFLQNELLEKDQILKYKEREIQIIKDENIKLEKQFYQINNNNNKKYSFYNDNSNQKDMHSAQISTISSEKKLVFAQSAQDGFRQQYQKQINTINPKNQQL